MDENIKGQDVLWVKEPSGERLKVVSGMDDKGNLGLPNFICRKI